MIKINRENVFGSLLNNLTQLLNPPKEPIIRGRCSALINNVQHISYPEIRKDPDTQKQICYRCTNHLQSNECPLSPGVIANAKVQKP